MDLILCSAQQATEGDQAKIALENGYQDGTLGQAAFQAAFRPIPWRVRTRSAVCSMGPLGVPSMARPEPLVKRLVRSSRLEAARIGG